MNPFKILGAVPMDSRQRLQALLQDAALLKRQEQADEAYAALIKPEARLEAELRWYPEKENAQDRPLWKLNRLLDRKGARRAPARLMLKACEYWEKQDAEDLLASLNADRAQGGWKEVQPEEMREAVKSYLNEIAAELDGLYQYDAQNEERLRKVSRIMANELRGKNEKKLVARYGKALLGVIGRYKHSELVETLVNRYELRFAAEIELLREDILSTTSQRKRSGKFSWRPGTLLRNVQDWSTLTMPMRKLIYTRGMHSISSEELADEVRLFMAELYNRFNDSLNAKQLISKLRRCFPEYEWLQKQLKEDEAVILNAKKRQKFEAKEQREKAMLPFGIMMIILAIILNRCTPEETPGKTNKYGTAPAPSEENLRLARIYLTNSSLREKREAIETKEKEIQMALALGGKVDIEALNAELLKLRAEYAALELGAKELLEELADD